MIVVPLYEVYFFALFLRVQKSISYLRAAENAVCAKAYEGGRRTLIVLAGYKFRQEVPK